MCGFIFFQEFDLDNDGIVSYLEIKTGLARMAVHVTFKEAKALVGAADDSGDGECTFEKFQFLLKDHVKRKNAAAEEEEKMKREEIERRCNIINYSYDGQHQIIHPCTFGSKCATITAFLGAKQG